MFPSRGTGYFLHFVFVDFYAVFRYALVPAAVQHGRGGLLHQGADGGAHPNHQGIAPVGGDQDAAGIALGYGLRHGGGDFAQQASAITMPMGPK